MKRKSIISMLLLSMMLGMFSTSCQDMLSPSSDRHAYTVAEDTLYSYWGILMSLQNIAERYVILNECRGDLVDATSFVSDTISAIVEFGNVTNPEAWKDGSCAYLRISDYYHIINSCNAYIANCDTKLKTGTNQPYMLKEYSQVQAIRAWVYMQLLYAYGPNRVPFYTQPMLTTDDIDNYLSSQHKLVNPQTLAEELGPELEQMELVEKQYGLPQYNYYGHVDVKNSHYVCHSSKCMFPVSIVLGDLYLLSGRYADAALHYYNYLNTRNCGPLLTDRYYSTGNIDDKKDNPIYNYYSNDLDNNSIPYMEKNAVSRSTEVITCIPTNRSKLDGKVMSSINRLFGFSAEMTTGGGESAEARVGLSRNYERELIPSKGYEALCDSQKYEVYVGEIGKDADGNDKFKWDENSTTLEVLPDVGDARRTWIYNTGGEQWTFRVGDNELYGKMVSKQNPRGSFTTTYPVVYRKSTVWLRFAEALNRAGFPSYAFAILKNGLCSNPRWLPYNPKEDYEYMIKNERALYYGNSSYFDYPVTDTIYVYRDIVAQQFVPEPWVDEDGLTHLSDQIHHLSDLEDYLTTYFQNEFDAYNAEHPDDPMTEPRTMDLSNVMWQPANEDAFKNTPSLVPGRDCACYYIDLRELERASDPSVTFLDFQRAYFNGSDDQLIFTKDRAKLQNPDVVRDRFPEDGIYTFTIGVHQRGCGLIRYDDPEYARSSYNYVSLVQKKIKEATGASVTEDEIYGGSYDAEVQNAVEDLIIDEMGLELAFEGSRFSDLYRAAERRGPDYLAQRIAKRRTGKVDESLRSWLSDKRHWFLPLPEE